MNRYKPNFIRGANGNKLSEGEDLKIKVDGASIITGQLLSKTKKFFWKRIQIEQSGHRSNPEKDTINFEMVKYDGNGGLIPMPKGKYRIIINAYIPGTTSYDNRWTDDFEII